MPRAPQESEACVQSVLLVQSLIKSKLAARDALLALLAVTAHAVRVWMGKSPTTHPSRLRACSVQLAQLARSVHVQTATPALLPTPTAQSASFAQLVDTALLESRVKHVLILLTRPAQLMVALPMTL